MARGNPELRAKALEIFDSTGKSRNEIAKELGVPGGTVRSWICRRAEAVKTSKKPKTRERFREDASEDIRGYKKFIIASVQNDTDIDENFYLSLRNCAQHINARLMIVPVHFRSHALSEWRVDECDLWTKDVQLHPNLRLMCNLRIPVTSPNQLVGIDPISKGDSLIIPGPQMAMRTLAAVGGGAAIAYNTGSVSKRKIYGNTRVGKKAEFNHSMSALIVEISETGKFHIRGLNADDTGGFYDINGYWTSDSHTPKFRLKGLVLGDEHISVRDLKVAEATHFANDSIIKTLCPEELVRHDSVDAGAISHHKQHSFFQRWGDHHFKKNSIAREMDEFGQFLLDTSRDDMINVIVDSNHNQHVYKFLDETRPQDDLENAHFWVTMTKLLMDSAKDTPIGTAYPNLLELWLANSKYASVLSRTVFTSSRGSYKIADIECGLHGDKGINGARGSAAQFAKFPCKVIVGHAHSPSILHGCYQVGTSSRKDLGYTSGASSWMHAHCAIYPNGKRQMIFVIDGEWHG